MTATDKTAIADLVAKYGSSSATAWLEFERYKLWRPSEPVPESSFTPVQGYMERDPYIFAWGNPLVSSHDALLPVARQFVQFCESQGKRPVWACVDWDLEEILGSPEFEWSTVSCIYEDVVDPAHILDLTSPEAKGKEGQHIIKDLKKNLGRAEKYHVAVKEMRPNDWTEEEKLAVEKGVKEWKSSKHGIQLASTSLEPWLDSAHRRYWLATKDDEPVGILILTPIQLSAWQIKNAISFPKSPKGTSEALIYTALKDLHLEEEKAAAIGQLTPHPAHGNIDTTPVSPPSKGTSTPEGEPSSESASSISSSGLSEPEDEDILSGAETASITETPSTPTSRQNSTRRSNDKQKDTVLKPPKYHSRDENRVTVTFGISAAPEFAPVRNLGGWKVKALSKTYKKVALAAKLIQRGEFRSKFDSEADPMYVCYPPNGFGLDGVNALLKVLRK
ncbi:hypothetical protein BDN70DRAFT_871073 [Pholiota conissans]|uniref:Phosphatidylglycerol lysyltransferase C-terminal domain-containing protein n=1 Tax=Pholiota conissans TaxID=109636 RepID=A0A9P5ZEN0_9AGAR|nr:hypothetical protein BDN70DRAFT_871073 [Pholiota conissans]